MITMSTHEEEKIRERAFTEGHRAAYRAILGQAVIGLIGGGERPEAEILLLQLEDVRAALRDVCGRYGDNDWPDDLHLADVIRKHLEPHLDEAFEDDEPENESEEQK